ncbi:MAG: MBOAT family protein [Deltaproteobacteria bacterium]|nr:MBOAT family protein [Deltaproteobacteria bacterium]
MSFSSLLFIFGFLPWFFLFYFSTPSRFKNYTALLGSALFYTWGAPRFLAVIVFTSICDYWFSKAIVNCVEGAKKRKLLLAFAVGLNLSIFFYFKYANFFVEQINAAIGAFGFSPWPWLEVALPIGISFITFEKISYLVDVYRGVTPPAKNLLSYALFLLLFPHLIAGPIFRYHDIQGQLLRRLHSVDLIFAGVLRFSVGLAKKVLIADPLGEVANNVFNLGDDRLSFYAVWIGISCYTFQIFFDFSGYSDMAIGLGKIMGFKFVENFNHPYISQNITEFWRRWHISLSNWMKEYLYIPLGGNRLSTFRTYVNLWTVFLLSGLWHGANWTFIFWGAYHGFCLILDRLFWLKLSSKLPRVVNIAVTFFLVMIGWVFFRAENISHATSFVKCLFSFSNIGLGFEATVAELFSSRSIAMFALAAILSFLPASRVWQLFEEKEHLRWSTIVVRGQLAFLIAILSVAFLVNSSFHPFIYFRF